MCQDFKLGAPGHNEALLAALVVKITGQLLRLVGSHDPEERLAGIAESIAKLSQLPGVQVEHGPVRSKDNRARGLLIQPFH